ncbi:MAG: DUF115 domain-containing protein [Treponema sp.]|nr:DUF115 domain-containing protein [Treponema sp.]
MASHELGHVLEEIPARRGKTISYKGLTLLSRVDPVAQGERLAAEVEPREFTLYLCPSPLYGYGLSVLLPKLPPNSAILCIEGDEALLELSSRALEDLLQKSRGESSGRQGGPALILAAAASPEELCTLVQKVYGKRFFRRLELLRLGGGWQLLPDLYKNIEEALQKEINLEWSNAMTLIRLGRLYSRNLIRNLALLDRSQWLETLDYGSAPVLALGAGPSLDAMLDDLAAHSGGSIPGPQDRPYKIICADTCLPALNERELVPDLVVALESQFWNLRAFSGAQGRHISAALDVSALPRSSRVLSGTRYLFSTPWTELNLLSRLADSALLPESIMPLGSVGLNVVALALAKSRGPIICSGLDFSFTIDAYHARSTPGHIDAARTTDRFKSLFNTAAVFREGSYSTLSKTGIPVRSDPALRSYRELFEREFGGNTRLADVYGPGLPLGIPTISSAEAYERLIGEGKEKSSPEEINPPKDQGQITEALIDFCTKEKNALLTMKDMLTGTITFDKNRLEELLDYADYLWAHFPECAGAAGQRPSSEDTNFLKRVRVEIDPFLVLWNLSLRDLEEKSPSYS